MKIVELIIDEDDMYSGIDAISLVDSPAIEENFVALNKQKKYSFKTINNEKRILMGALLVPNKTIYRKDGDEEYYIYFSKATIKKASEMYLMNGKQNNSTLEHNLKLSGISLVESWIVEDKDKDKSSIYGLDVPVGTWVGAVKVNNDEVWNEYVKTGKVRGFSIEGYFADKTEKMSNIENEIEAGLKLLKIKKLIIENK
tara:strand:+ start:725 stop:1321 length:597 start_codon:yes stop_codon:yes gene_type:complete